MPALFLYKVLRTNNLVLLTIFSTLLLGERIYLSNLQGSQSYMRMNLCDRTSFGFLIKGKMTWVPYSPVTFNQIIKPHKTKLMTQK